MLTIIKVMAFAASVICVLTYQEAVQINTVDNKYELRKDSVNHAMIKIIHVADSLKHSAQTHLVYHEAPTMDEFQITTISHLHLYPAILQYRSA